MTTIYKDAECEIKIRNGWLYFSNMFGHRLKIKADCEWNENTNFKMMWNETTTYLNYFIHMVKAIGIKY